MEQFNLFTIRKRVKGQLITILAQKSIDDNVHYIFKRKYLDSKSKNYIIGKNNYKLLKC